MKLGLYVICLLIIFIAACYMPWWYIPAAICVFTFFKVFIKEDYASWNPKHKKNQQKILKKYLEEERLKANRKSGQVRGNKNRKKNTTVIGDTATVLAGAALAQQVIKHHKNSHHKDVYDNYLDVTDDEIDELYNTDLSETSYGYDDVYFYNHSDYDSSSYDNSAYEEQAAYDDFLASLDD